MPRTPVPPKPRKQESFLPPWLATPLLVLCVPLITWLVGSLMNRFVDTDRADALTARARIRKSIEQVMEAAPVAGKGILGQGGTPEFVPQRDRSIRADLGRALTDGLQSDLVEVHSTQGQREIREWSMKLRSSGQPNHFQLRRQQSDDPETRSFQLEHPTAGRLGIVDMRKIDGRWRVVGARPVE